jgi:hypothetical protein
MSQETWLTFNKQILNKILWRSAVCVRDCNGNPFYFFSLKNKKIVMESPTEGNAPKINPLISEADFTVYLGEII